jgi:RHS repeat-associated protein
MKNHLGNVLLVVTDLKLGQEIGSADDTTDYYLPEVVAASDYYPFGIAMSGRTWQGGSYRYGFNGKEADGEWNGEGNTYDFGARVYDGRLGRWMSVDPRFNPEESPYQAMDLSPIWTMDPNGEDGLITIKGDVITIKVNVYVHGSGVTAKNIIGMKKRMMSTWNYDRFGDPFSYTSEEGKTYKVNFEINVLPKEDPWYSFFPPLLNTEDNFVELVATEEELDQGQSSTSDFRGQWRGFGRNGRPLSEDDPSPHELGHLLGLGEKYGMRRFDFKYVDPEADKQNIMARWPENGGLNTQHVNQGIIDHLVKDHVKNYESSSDAVYQEKIKGSDRDNFPGAGDSPYDKRWSGHKDRK